MEMIITPFSSFSRPANTTQYTANDLVADNATAGSVTPLTFSLYRLGGSGIIRRARLHKTTTTATVATFTLHLFSAAPTVTNGDNGAFAISSVASLLGSIAIDMSSGAVAGTGSLKQFSAATAIGVDFGSLDSTIYGLLVATGAYAPGSGETFTATLEVEG